VATIAPAAVRAKVPGSGTAAGNDAVPTAAEGIAGTGIDAKNSGSPTARFVPSAIACGLVTISVLLATVVPPVYDFVHQV
jgi:hypothetical protein